MEMEQRLAAPPVPKHDLEERVRLIVELWGEGEPLDGGRIAEVAGNLYGAGPEQVRDAIIANIRKGMIRGKFYVPGDAMSRPDARACVRC
ncbi:MAG: hypothetical protein JSV27_10985 [Candidatus Bathyarchaeota archaeon]|nr:MAG: hypothetical protein JSV27_10985 [Candidatus Bathyarchaeota archaeon]